MKAWQHFCTITHHKILVMKGCFRVGLYRQGLMHDLSKYGWTEFRGEDAREGKGRVQTSTEIRR